MQSTSFPRASVIVSLALSLFCLCAHVTPAWAQPPVNQPPTIVVTAPTAWTIGDPEIHVVASCVDDTPGCYITVQPNGGARLAVSDDGTIDTLVRPPDGEQLLHFYAEDAAGDFVTKVVPIVVLSAPTVRPVNRANNVFLDINDTHLLTWSGNKLPVWPPDSTLATASIYDRQSRLNPTIWTASSGSESVSRGVLTPAGALLVTWAGGSYLPRLQEWRAGVLTDLGPIDGRSLVVNGRWAIFTVGGLGQQPLMLRDLMTGTNTVVSNAAGPNEHDVTADGRVIFWTSAEPHQLMEWTPGPPPATTQLTNSAPLWSWQPVTDGSRVVFLRLVNNNGGPRSLILRDAGGSEITLATYPYPISSLPRLNYRVAGGWVAFHRIDDATGSMQLWLRAPDGTERRMTSSGGGLIEALRENGEIVFSFERNDGGGHYSNHRVLAFPDGRTIDLGLKIGTPVYTDGAWYLTVGPHLLGIAEAPARAILAEGATGPFFTTDVAIFNPHETAVPVTIRYLREQQTDLTETRVLPAMSRTTIRENDIPGLESTSVSTVVEAPSMTPVVVERLMSWDASGYGGHLATAVDQPSRRWFFAEGAQGFFSTYFLLANSEETEAEVTLTFLIELGTPITHTLKVPPRARLTVDAGSVPGLNARSFATTIQSNVPIVAERAMYFGTNPLWSGGHGSMGVTETSMNWAFAEGVTGSFFDTFLLLSNPGEADTNVTLSYRTQSNRRVERTHALPAFSRLTINIEDEAPELRSASMGIYVYSSHAPFVAERAAYWGFGGWHETHNSFGVTRLGNRWAIAEGRSRLDRWYQTFILLANHEDLHSQVRLTFVREDGLKFERLVDVNGRYTLDTSTLAELANSRFSTLVEVVTGSPISVESSIYWTPNGITWEGGGNTAATRLQ